MNWKDAYKQEWETSERREDFVQYFFLSRGFEVQPFGFEALSTNYNPNHPAEQGIPDFKITNPLTKKSIYVEVTGTRKLSEFDLIWIRPDKIDYAKNHPEKHIFLAHVIDDSQLLRFIFLSNINFIHLTKIHPIINGNQECYYTIQPKFMLNKNIFNRVI